MSMRINSKPPAQMSTLRHLQNNKQEMAKTTEKLSGGKRINDSADDAAALALAEKISAALSGMEQGLRNLSDGYALVQTADGGMDSMSGNLHRMRELAMTAASGTISADQRQAVQDEFASLKAEIDRTSASTSFGDQQLLDGSAGEVQISVGQSSDAGPEFVAVDLGVNLDSSSLGLADSRVDGPDGSNALAALEDVDQALASLGTHRADLGASGNSLESAHQGLARTMENSRAAHSRIMDTDYALEASQLVRQQILAQAGQSVMAQGNLLAGTALNLLR